MTVKSSRLKAAAVATAAIALAGSVAFATSAGAASKHSGVSKPEAPIGIVSADPEEQAPILAKMHVTRHVDIAGYTYWIGTMGGKPVIDTASGEVDETAELATWILDATFHPRATLFTGTAGANNAKINVGDVVLSGYVADKSQIHYELGGYQVAYSGIELHAVGDSDAVHPAAWGAPDRSGGFESGEALGRGELAHPQPVRQLGGGHLPSGGEGLDDGVVGDLQGACHGDSFGSSEALSSKDLPPPGAHLKAKDDSPKSPH